MDIHTGSVTQIDACRLLIITECDRGFTATTRKLSMKLHLSLFISNRKERVLPSCLAYFFLRVNSRGLAPLQWLDGPPQDDVAHYGSGIKIHMIMYTLFT